MQVFLCFLVCRISRLVSSYTSCFQRPEVFLLKRYGSILCMMQLYASTAQSQQLGFTSAGLKWKSMYWMVWHEFKSSSRVKSIELPCEHAGHLCCSARGFGCQLCLSDLCCCPKWCMPACQPSLSPWVSAACTLTKSSNTDKLVWFCMRSIACTASHWLLR